VRCVLGIDIRVIALPTCALALDRFHATLFAMTIKFKLELADEGDDEIKLDGIEFATARLLAQDFGLSASRIAALGRNGDIDAWRFGKTWFISRPSLDEYLVLGSKGRAKARGG
jgi:hypothetical protein